MLQYEESGMSFFQSIGAAHQDFSHIRSFSDRSTWVESTYSVRIFQPTTSKITTISFFPVEIWKTKSQSRTVWCWKHQRSETGSTRQSPPASCSSTASHPTRYRAYLSSPKPGWSKSTAIMESIWKRQRTSCSMNPRIWWFSEGMCCWTGLRLCVQLRYVYVFFTLICGYHIQCIEQ